MYALVLNESRILKWEGRNKERRTKSTKKKKRREKDEFNEEEKSKKQKQRWTYREANKTKTLEVKNKQQSPAHSLSVSPDTSLSDIQVYTPRTTSHTVCATMLAEAGPLTESRGIYLSPLYLSDKSIQACIQACNSQLRRGSVSLNTKHTSMH